MPITTWDKYSDVLTEWEQIIHNSSGWGQAWGEFRWGAEKEIEVFTKSNLETGTTWTLLI